MKEIADEPRAGNEQSDAASHERCEIGPQVPVRLACRAGFATLVVAGDPYILRGVKDGEDSTAVARLRRLISGAQFEKRGQHEPEELGYRESDWRDHGAVSYTHLDVYKRQVIIFVDIAPPENLAFRLLRHRFYAFSR